MTLPNTNEPQSVQAGNRTRVVKLLSCCHFSVHSLPGWVSNSYTMGCSPVRTDNPRAKL